MDYKELIKQFRDESTFQRDRFSRFVLADELEAAATAIETLLAEREAAIEDLRLIGCEACKYQRLEAFKSPCCECIETGSQSDFWEWRGPTPPDREQKGGGNDV